jgi:hypothetical protein
MDEKREAAGTLQAFDSGQRPRHVSRLLILAIGRDTFQGF